MFSVYSVDIRNGKKYRYFVAAYESEKEARVMADYYAAVASYAYVKGVGDGSAIYFARHRDYSTAKPTKAQMKQRKYRPSLV